MSDLKRSQIETFIDDSVLEGLVFKVAEEDNFTASFFPRLSQSKTAHHVAGSYLGGAIGSNYQLFE